MPEVIQCPHCDRKLKVPENLLGKTVKCPSCGQTFIAEEEILEPPLAEEEEEAPRPSKRRAEPVDEEEEEERPRPRRRPAEEEEDDEDDEPRPRRRRRRRPPSRSEALGQVSGPATALLVVAILGLVCAPVGIIGHMAGVGGGAAGAGMQPGGGQMPAWATVFSGTLGLISNIVALGVSILILFGALKMKKLESYGLAMTASILAMLPMVTPCCILGLPFGIWAIVALNKPEVKSAFE